VRDKTTGHELRQFREHRGRAFSALGQSSGNGQDRLGLPLLIGSQLVAAEAN
jgi:hypothetical protein